MKSLIKEINNMLKMKIFTGVLRDDLMQKQRKAIIRCSTFMKYLACNVFQKLKATIVAHAG